MTPAAGRFLVVLLSTVMLGSCSCVQPRTAPVSAVEIEHPPVLPPLTLGSSHSAQQVLRAAFGGKEVTLRCVVIVHGEHLQVIVLTATGQRALSLDWDGVHWQVERAPMVPAQLQAEQLVADLQFALWPIQALKDAYAAGDWDVSEPGGGVRRLRHDGRLFAEVHYADADPWTGRFWLVNFRYGYSLAIEWQPPEG